MTINLPLAAAALTATSMLALWWLGRRLHNFSYVDLGWAANFVMLAALCAAAGPGSGARRALIASMYALHGGRLAWHLGRRIVGHPEESRYQELRSRWNGDGLGDFRFLAFFEFQAALNLLFATPLLIASANPVAALTALEIVAAALFAVGFAGETIADAQLAAFKRRAGNHGSVCDRGLWRYSRHPNYFFEWLMWVAYSLFAGASPYGWLALPLPLVMLHFLVNVTGIKPTEAQALRSKGESYRRYQARTSAFVPWPPRPPT